MDRNLSDSSPLSPTSSRRSPGSCDDSETCPARKRRWTSGRPRMALGFFSGGIVCPAYRVWGAPGPGTSFRLEDGEDVCRTTCSRGPSRCSRGIVDRVGDLPVGLWGRGWVEETGVVPPRTDTPVGPGPLGLETPRLTWSGEDKHEVPSLYRFLGFLVQEGGVPRTGPSTRHGPTTLPGSGSRRTGSRGGEGGGAVPGPRVPTPRLPGPTHRTSDLPEWLGYKSRYRSDMWTRTQTKALTTRVRSSTLFRHPEYRSA